MIETVDIKVGYSCNNDCYHCVIADKRRELLIARGTADRSTEEVMQLIEEAGRDGAKNIVLTGGEITIRRDFFEILEKALATVQTVIIQTNGRMFYYEEYAKRMATYERAHVTIAIHSIKPEVHDWITGSKGSFEQTTQGVRNLVKYGIKNRIGGKLVISKKNMDDLTNVIMLCKELGCNSLNIAFPHAMGNARLNFYDCVPKYSEVKDEILKATKKSVEIGLHIDWEAVPLCFLPGYETFASELRLSEHTRLNDLTHTDENYSISRKTRAKKKGPQCKKCRYDLICEGVWGDYVEGYDISELTPIQGEKITDLRMLESFKIHPVQIRN
ncbi:MAG: radical SAM protein [Nanoarchaeota archaeon]|nr:radical SAM protein [Nanoarchaeota archaeon]MBU1854162.1 radical SAM protein [Nanoarchaeota archaeon]